MNEKFQRILGDIKKSTKEVKVLPVDETVKEKVSEKYSIHPESLKGLLLENTEGMVIDYWMRFYGSEEIDFMTRNQRIPFDDIVIAEDMDINLSQFLYWCLHGDTDTFYVDYQWRKSSGWSLSF